jgi:indoleamine 2,3-dioxygenase
MPGKHREFLQLVSKLPSLRAFVEKNHSCTELNQAYENCMKQLRSWRSKHIAVVSKYIVRPARLAAHGGQNGITGKKEMEEFEADDGEALNGTGGSALIPFLKQARDETVGLQSSN